MISEIVRGFVSIIQYVAAPQFFAYFVDCYCVWLIYSQIRPNPSVLLLAILSTLKAQNLLWFMVGADYTPNYTDGICYAIAAGLNFGWFINDHIASISTFQKAVAVVSQNKSLTRVSYAVLSSSLVLGAILRVFSFLCLGGECHFRNPDGYITLNVLVTEFFFVGLLTQHLYKIYKDCGSGDNTLKILIDNGLLRIICLLFFGIMELLATFLASYENNDNPNQPKLPNSIQWFFVLGVQSRLMYPTILGLSIVLTKLKRVTGDTTKKVSNRVSHPVSDSGFSKKTVE
ncbi:hypothetical protein HDV06_006263 [Boothiomyces sp. JEL0866]|nr:hypothetical protein HDV06_006263 [Boothiomyces sp. JEL0866]